MSYDDIAVHQLMLDDSIRTLAYERALKQVVLPGHRVLDFGTGSGILSYFASRAGAEQVYAVDKSNFIRSARVVAEKNGFSNISFYHDDEDTLKLPSKVDVIVSEWMGHFGLNERLLEPLCRLRDAFLAPGGQMIPRRLHLRAGLVLDESIYADLSFFRGQPYGIDYSAVADWPFHRVEPRRFEASQVLPEIVDLMQIDLASCAGMPDQFGGTMIPGRADSVFGICGWFEAELTDSVVLKTGPLDPPTHWQQLFFPFCDPFRLVPHQPVEIGFQPVPDKDDRSLLWRWSMAQGDHFIEMDDFVHRAWTLRDLPAGLLP